MASQELCSTPGESLPLLLLGLQETYSARTELVVENVSVTGVEIYEHTAAQSKTSCYDNRVCDSTWSVRSLTQMYFLSY